MLLGDIVSAAPVAREVLCPAGRANRNEGDTVLGAQLIEKCRGLVLNGERVVGPGLGLKSIGHKAGAVDLGKGLTDTQKQLER